MNIHHLIKSIKLFIKYFLKIYGEIFYKPYKFKKKFNVNIFGVNDISHAKDHFFVGYYDIDPLSSSKDVILCHRVSKNFTSKVLPKYGDIGLMSISSGNFIKLTETKSLNWQLGSRAQWLNDNAVIYNDIDNDYHISRIFSVDKKKIIKEFKRSFWAISPNKKIGASLNFSRIKDKRPGYGYNGKSIDDKEEIFSLFDLETGEDNYVISLDNILKKINFFPRGADPYLNHVAWSPCSTKLITVFHFAEYDNLPRRTYPVIFDIEKDKWEVLDNNGVFSHNIWIDRENIVAFRMHNNEQCYCLWNYDSGWSPVYKSMIKKDGHPSLVNNTRNIIFDEYPNLLGKIQLYKGSLDSMKSYESIGYVMSPKEYTGALRCDLHPRVSACNTKVICDIPTKKGRKILLIEGNYVN